MLAVSGGDRHLSHRRVTPALKVVVDGVVRSPIPLEHALVVGPRRNIQPHVPVRLSDQVSHAVPPFD